MPDAVKAFRQDMQQEAPDELIGGERQAGGGIEIGRGVPAIADAGGFVVIIGDRRHLAHFSAAVNNKILKSGCRAEDSRLRTAQRLANLIAVFCIVSWRVFWMTMLNRAVPDAPAELALTRSEHHLLDHLLMKRPAVQRSLSCYLIKIARLGGYLARGSDPPPGNIVMWRGLSRLRDIEIGANIPGRCG